MSVPCPCCLIQGSVLLSPARTAALLSTEKTRHLWLWRTDGLRGLLRRQWLRTGNSGWKDLNGCETISFMIQEPEQCQSYGKWIGVCLPPDLRVTPKASSCGSFCVLNQMGDRAVCPKAPAVNTQLADVCMLPGRKLEAGMDLKSMVLGLTSPLLANWNFGMGKRAGKLQHCNACCSGKDKYLWSLGLVLQEVPWQD